MIRLDEIYDLHTVFLSFGFTEVITVNCKNRVRNEDRKW